MSLFEHLIVHAVTAAYHGIRKFGYESTAKEHFLSSGFRDEVASEKAEKFAKEMEEAKERNASKDERKKICIRHGLPTSLFFN